jgi:hypothetical protein
MLNQALEIKFNNLAALIKEEREESNLISEKTSHLSNCR